MGGRLCEVDYLSLDYEADSEIDFEINCAKLPEMMPPRKLRGIFFFHSHFSINLIRKSH